MELLYRRRTHWTMALAGGASALLIDQVRRMRGRLLPKAILCGVGITGIEYLFGRIWNQNYAIWDYRHTPLNLHGQICLPYTLMWCGLSACMLAALDMCETNKSPDS